MGTAGVLHAAQMGCCLVSGITTDFSLLTGGAGGEVAARCAVRLMPRLTRLARWDDGRVTGGSRT